MTAIISPSEGEVSEGGDDVDWLFEGIFDIAQSFHRISDATQKWLTESQINHFESAVRRCPTFGPFWRTYAEALLECAREEDALQVYQRGLKLAASLELHVSYIICLYGRKEVMPLLDSLTSALMKVGADIRAHALWIELIMLRSCIREKAALMGLSSIHQSNVSAMLSDKYNLSLPVHTCPKFSSSFASRRILRSCIPPTGFRLFTNSDLMTLVHQNLRSANPADSPSPSVHHDRFQEEQNDDVLRKVYLNWLSTPTEHLNLGLTAYSNFEKSIHQGTDSSSSTSTSKLLGTAKKLMAASVGSLKQLKVTWGDINKFSFPPYLSGMLPHWEYPAQPPDRQMDRSWTTLSKTWFETLSFESANPLKLSPQLYKIRMLSMYGMCLSTCCYMPRFWLSYFQELLAITTPSLAVSQLEFGIEQFLPRNVLLRYILYHYHLMYRNDVASAGLQLANLILSELQSTAHQRLLVSVLKDIWPSVDLSSLDFLLRDSAEKTDAEKNDMKPETCQSSGLYYLLTLIRLQKGVDATMKAFELLHPLGNASLYYQMGQQIWRLTSASHLCQHILNLGYHRFQHDPEYLHFHGQLLLDMGLVSEAMQHYKEALLKLHAETGKVCYTLWLRFSHLCLVYSDPKAYKRDVAPILSCQQASIDYEKWSAAVGCDQPDVDGYLNPAGPRTSSVPPPLLPALPLAFSSQQVVLSEGLPSDEAVSEDALAASRAYLMLSSAGISKAELQLQRKYSDQYLAGMPTLESIHSIFESSLPKLELGENTEPFQIAGERIEGVEKAHRARAGDRQQTVVDVEGPAPTRKQANVTKHEQRRSAEVKEDYHSRVFNSGNALAEPLHQLLYMLPQGPEGQTAPRRLVEYVMASISSMKVPSWNDDDNKDFSSLMTDIAPP